jgi:hypothetical protein
LLKEQAFSKVTKSQARGTGVKPEMLNSGFKTPKAILLKLFDDLETAGLDGYLSA